MNPEEREILELVGAYHLLVQLVPTAWYDAEPKPIKLIRAEDQGVLETWWNDHEPKPSAFQFLNTNFVRKSDYSQSGDLREFCWTDGDFHRIECWQTMSGAVCHFDIRIDVRRDYADFLTKIAEFAKHAECIFFLTRDEIFLRPSPTLLFEASLRSPAAALAQGNRPWSNYH